MIFLKAIGERSIKTFAQVVAAMITVEGFSTGVLDIDWVNVLSVAALAALASLATSVGTAGATNGSPSMGDAETLRQG